MKKKLILESLLVEVLVILVAAQVSSGQSKGTVIATGGGFGSGVREKFVALAGGPEANFVYIPTAASGIKLDSGFIYTPPDDDSPAANTREFEQELAKEFGVKRLTVLHTRNRHTANSEAFVQTLRKAQGVWIS
jgi:cyanophycinase